MRVTSGLLMENFLRDLGLVQQRLARRFGVAQGVVREALLELQAYGLVETIDNRGIFVSQLTPKTLLDALEIREIHEGLAARLCCERTTRGDRRELEEIARRMHQLALDGQAMESAWLDREFHHRLTHLSGNMMLIRLADNYRVLGKVIQLSREPQEVLDAHTATLEAIESGKGEAAEALMRTHVRRLREQVEAAIAKGGFIPRWLVDRPSETSGRTAAESGAD